MPRAYGSSTRLGQVIGHFKQSCRCLAVEPPVEAECAASIARARAIRDGSPASSERSRPRAWKSAPRIVSTTLRPAAADQQTSIRVRSAAAISLGRADGTRVRAAATAPAAREERPATATGYSAETCHPRQYGLEGGEPLVDVPADQELHGRAALSRARQRLSRSPRPRGRRGQRRPLDRHWPGRRRDERGGSAPGPEPRGSCSRARR